MKFKDNLEFRTGFCSICGKSIGTGFNHQKCSRIKQKKAAPNKPKAKATAKQLDYLARTYR